MHLITVNIEVEEDRRWDAVAIAGGVLNWIEDCDGVVDTELVRVETIEED